jgi:hypothetical protein
VAVFDDLVAAASPTVIERHIHRQAGASWEIRQYLEVDTVPVDWTGCTAFCQVRDRAGALIYAFTSLTLTNAGWLTLTATPTATGVVPPGDYVYDVDVVNAASRRLPLMAGSFKVGKQVTV